MRAGRTAGIAVAIVLATVLIVGLGYALTPLYGYSYSENNSTGVGDKTIDVYVNNGAGYVPLAANIVFPTYDDSGFIVPVSGDYEVVIKQNGADATGYVRLWCDMNNDASWALIERMYVKYDDIVDEHGYQREFDFGVSETNGQITTGLPTDAVQLTGEVPFTIYVQFKDFGYTVDDNDEILAAFAGSKFVFAFDGTDPLS